MSVNIFIVRTRLQALIAKNIESEYFPKKKSIFVFTYQYRKDEDLPEVYEVYEKLKLDSFFSIDVVSSHGFLKSFLKFFFLHIFSFVFRSKIHLAGVDSYPFALSAKIFPLSRIRTFDDGAANILDFSKYYSEESISGKGVKKIILRALFPKGCAIYIRERSDRHYTIFKDFSNIIDRKKIINLKWDWSSFLDARDLPILKDGTNNIVLGTPMDDYEDSEKIQKRAQAALIGCDIYIRHPREKVWAENSRMVQFRSPAESILVKLAKKEKISVYHFNSTVAYSLKNHKNIVFIDLIAEKT